MPDRRLTVFISSSTGELADEREAANAAVRALRLQPVMHELTGPADARERDVFVGVYWQEYGWVGRRDGVSAIEEEYAQSAGVPRLVYVKEPAPGREPALGRLLERMRIGDRVACRTFATPGELAELLIDDLTGLMSQRFYAGRKAAHDLPEGVVTFLFADLDGSTPIVQRLGEAYPELVLDPFRSVVHEAVRAGGGAVVDFEGDGAVCVFRAADAAARAAVAMQRLLSERRWPAEVSVRARIGLHTGTPIRTHDGYAGLEVHRAARIGAAANGGQILVSRATADLLAGHEDLRLLDLGSFALKGLDRAEPLAQVVAPGLPRDLPPPRARGVSSVRLPTYLTRLVGRDSELEQIASRLEPHEVRLVTLTGPGGIGKTRLAVAVAERAAAAYPDGVFFVPLADTRTQEQVVAALAESLGVRGEGARPLLDTIEEHLAADRVLLVLDNVEQVLGAGAEVERLLSRCPGTDVIVTSRAPLRLPGEYEYAVPPLHVPAAGVEAAAGRECSAVQLFEERAAASRPDWKPSEAELAAVAEICRRLDGLPLALELAASRLRVLDPVSLLQRLGSSLDVVGGLPHLPARQRTLAATIAWSHDLLADPERTLFARLAVFSGGWTLEAAEAVCGDERVPDVLASLERLSEVSLAARERGSSGAARMRMLETIREFAEERLHETGELEVLRERHAACFERLTEEQHALFSGPGAAEALARLDDDWENVTAAVSRRLATREFAAVVRTASAAWRYVWFHDRVPEAARWMAPAYEARRGLEPSLRGELSRIWGSALYQLGDYPAARAALEEAVELLAESGPPDREAWARTILGGLLPHFEHDLGGALGETSRAAQIFRAERNDFGLATALGLLGTVETLLGRLDEGRAALEESVVAAERVRLPSLVGANLTLRGLASLAAGELEEARGLLEAAARMPLYLEGTAYCLEGLAAVALAEGDELLGAKALGAAEGLRQRTGIRMWPIMRMAFQPTLDALERAGDDVRAARYDGTRTNPRELLGRLAGAMRAQVDEAPAGSQNRPLHVGRQGG